MKKYSEQIRKMTDSELRDEFERLINLSSTDMFTNQDYCKYCVVSIQMKYRNKINDTINKVK